MPPPLLKTRMIKSILQHRLGQGLSLQATALAVGVSKGVVAKYATLAQARGLAWQVIEAMTEPELQACLLGERQQPAPPVAPDFAHMHRELMRKGMTLMLLWQEYQAQHPGVRTLQYSQFCERYRQYTRSLKRSMRQVHRAGEKLFVDFAGPTLALADGSRAHLFVAALGASHYTFAQALPGQRTEDWIEGMVQALHFIGGVPELIVPDNPRAVIAQPDRYEPRANESVLDFARHYGCTVLPARPRKPQDKAVVESAVQVVERWILARLRHHHLASLHEANRAISPLLSELNARKFQKLPGSRASTFAEIDAPALQPLPARRYAFARFKSVRVHPDSHVDIERHRYSVPHQLVGQRLDARITAHGIELLHAGQRVAVHGRSTRAGGYTTLAEHLPDAWRQHRQWSPQRLQHWASSVGPQTAAVVQAMLARHKHPEQGYRSCLGLLALSRRHGRERLEAACQRAIELDCCHYRAVRTLLDNGAEHQDPASHTGWQSPSHEHLRGARAYH